jgi:hypothetical protein
MPGFEEHLLICQFSQMFPEHACTARRGATGCIEEYQSLISA